MLPFVVLLLTPILLQHIRIKGIDYQKKNEFAITLFLVGLTVLVMFRHASVGTDTYSYLLSFEQVDSVKWNDLNEYYSSEVGFWYLMKTISLISSQPQFFLIVTAIMISAMIIPTYRRLCLDASLTIVLFCTMSTFVMMFSGIRQMIAVAIGFIAYELTRRKKLVAFLIVVIIAIMFHSSAFMLLFMYPLFHVKITKKWLYFVVPVMVVIFIFNRPFFASLSFLLEKYSRFDSEISSTGSYTMLILFVFFAVFSFLVVDEEKIDSETLGLRNFLLFAIVIQMFAPLHTLAMRMNYYYIIFIPLLLPRIIALRKDRWKQVVVVSRHIMVVFFLAYFFVFAYTGGALKVFPYHFFWENVI